nr:unnamed protein product [Callosobruchus analis]
MEKRTVVIVFDTNNVSNHKSLKKALHNILPLSKMTNIVLLSRRSQVGDIIIQKYIHETKKGYRDTNRNVSIDFRSNLGNVKNAIRVVTKLYINSAVLALLTKISFILQKSKITYTNLKNIKKLWRWYLC